MSLRPDTRVLLDDLAFPEAPRWRGNRLWLTDQHAKEIVTVTLAGERRTVATLDDHPGGLGWLPDGTLLVVAMTARRVLRLVEGSFEAHAELWNLASYHCNDMVVDPEGRAYVGNFGFDLWSGMPEGPAEIIRVEPDGRADVVADGVIFPNGGVISPDGRTLIVAETFANRMSAFAIGPDGSLGPRRTWAELGDHTPDGICLDAEGGVWLASPETGQVLRVEEGGRIVDQRESRGTPYACMLGGPDRRTLFIATSDVSDPAEAVARRSGRIEITGVRIPGTGIP